MHSSSTDRPPGARPWDRQPGETGPAWRAFCVYRDDVREDVPSHQRRSLTRAALLLNKKGTRQLEKWCSRCGWVARCDAYDDHILAEAQRELEDAEIELETKARRARLTLRARRIDALLGDPDAVIVPDDAERDPYPDPRKRGLVDGLLDLIAAPWVKGGPKIAAYKLLEERSGLADEPKPVEEDNDAALLEALRGLADYLHDDEAPLFWRLIESAAERREKERAFAEDDPQGEAG